MVEREEKKKRRGEGCSSRSSILSFFACTCLVAANLLDKPGEMARESSIEAEGFSIQSTITAGLRYATGCAYVRVVYLG